MKQVLIIDDNPMDQRIAGACVQENGLESIYAADGAEALSLLEQTSVDVVLSDLDMPGVNGLEVVRNIRMHQPHIPVILMTAKGSEDIAAEALRCGASSYVAKRNLNRDLAAALRIAGNLVRKSKNREAIYTMLHEARWKFVVQNDIDEASNIVRHFQDVLSDMKVCDELQLIGVGTAILEAVSYAIDYGNLELSDQPDADLAELDRVRSERLAAAPYFDRRISLSFDVSHRRAQFVVSHEGPGFVAEFPDHVQSKEMLDDEEERGLVLMRLFMDEVVMDEARSSITLVIDADAP